jgi:predicted RNase H-like HicB family nuclease
MLDQLCQEFLSKVSTHGFTLDDVLQNLEQRRKR